MSYVNNLCLLLVLMVLAICCVDEVEFDVDEGNSVLSIEGQFSDSLTWHYVTVAMSIDAGGFGSKIIQEPIAGATVKLLRSDGDDELFLEDSVGRYAYFGAGSIGETYQLEVTLGDGNTYISNPHTMPAAVPIGELNSFVTKEEFVNVNGEVVSDVFIALETSGPLEINGAPAYTMFRMSAEFEIQEYYPMILDVRTCYVKQTLDFGNLKVYSGEEEPGMSLKNERIFLSDLSFEFFFNYGYNVVQYSIDRATYDYWTAVSQLIQTEQTIFAPPPGTIIGDFTKVNGSDEQVLGFFTVGSTSQKWHFTNVLALDETVFPLCQDPADPNFERLAPECFNCLLFNNSTLVKPPYWP